MLVFHKIADKIKTNRLTLKLFLSFVGAAALSVLVVAIIFSYWFSRKSMDSINSMTQMLLTQTTAGVTNAFEISRKTAVDIFNSPDITTALGDGTPDKTSEFLASLYLKKILSLNSTIYSVYVCNSGSLVLGYGGDYDFVDTPQDIARLAKESRILYPITRTVKAKNGDILDVISFVYFDPSLNHSSVIVNVKAQIVDKLITSGNPDSGQSILITDTNGNAIVSTGSSDPPVSAAGGQKLLQMAASLKSTSGYFNYDMDGSRYRINYQYFDEGRLVAFYVNDYKSFVQDITRMRNTIIFICLAVLLLIGLSAIILYRRLYSPINQVFSSIRSLAEPAPSTAKNTTEMKDISGAVGSIIQRLNSLEKDKREREESTERSNFFHSLLLSQEVPGKDELIKSLTRFSIAANAESSGIMVVLRLSRHTDFLRDNTANVIELLLDSIEKITVEIIATEFKCLSSRLDSGHIAILAVLPPNFPGNAAGIMEDLLRRAQNAIFGLLGIEVSAGISRPFNSLDTEPMRDAYREAYGNTDYRLIYGRLCVISSSSLYVCDDKDNAIGKCTEGMVAAVKNGSLAEFEVWTDKLLLTVRTCSYARVLNAFHSVITEMIQIPANLHKTMIGRISVSADEAYTKLKEFESLQDVKSWLKDLYKQTWDILSRMKAKPAQDIMNDIFKEIDENFSDHNLSANLMAERLSVTPQYFSKLFHEHTGLSFPDYVNNIRMEKARELLLTKPELDIGEICLKIGYGNKSYFTTSFKKKYGVTPANYRNIT